MVNGRLTVEFSVGNVIVMVCGNGVGIGEATADGEGEGIGLLVGTGVGVGGTGLGVAGTAVGLGEGDGVGGGGDGGVGGTGVGVGGTGLGDAVARGVGVGLAVGVGVTTLMAILKLQGKLGQVAVRLAANADVAIANAVTIRTRVLIQHPLVLAQFSPEMHLFPVLTDFVPLLPSRQVAVAPVVSACI